MSGPVSIEREMLKLSPRYKVWSGFERMYVMEKNKQSPYLSHESPDVAGAVIIAVRYTAAVAAAPATPHNKERK